MPGQCRGTPSFHASTPSPSPSASPLPSPWKSEVHKKNPKEGRKMENPVQPEAVRPTLDESTFGKSWTGWGATSPYHNSKNNRQSLLSRK